MSVHIDPILPPERRRAMHQAGLWHDRVLLDDLDYQSAHAPHRVAVVGSNSVTGQRTVLSYGEFARRADRIAGGLARLGVEPGDIVSYESPNWWEFVALHLALLRLGAVSNPLMPIFRERERVSCSAWRNRKFSSCRRRSAASTSSPWRRRCVRACRRCAMCWPSAATAKRRSTPAGPRHDPPALRENWPRGGRVPTTWSSAGHLRHHRRAERRDAHIQHAVCGAGPVC